MAMTCQSNRQWAEALALYQRSETYITQAEGKNLKDNDFKKYNAARQDLTSLRNLVNSGKCAAHAQNILGVDDISAAMSGLTVRSKKVKELEKMSFDYHVVIRAHFIEFGSSVGRVCRRLEFDYRYP